MRASKQVDILVGRDVVDQYSRIIATRGHGIQATVRTGGQMSVRVQQVQLIAIDNQIDRIFYFGDLPAKEEIRSFNEGSVLPCINPDST